jgi:hypothetical protein
MPILLTLAACAGGPIALKTDPNAKEVEVAGVRYVVSPTGPDTYGAVHQDFYANNLFVSNASLMTRKAGFIAAVERATGCRVVDSVMDQSNTTLQARVNCSK